MNDRPKNLGALNASATISGARLLALDDRLADTAITEIAGELPFGDHSRAIAIEAIAAANAAPYSRAARQGARDIRRAGAPSIRRLEEMWGKCFPRVPVEIATRAGEILTPADLDLKLPAFFNPSLAYGYRNEKGEVKKPGLPATAWELSYEEIAQLIDQLSEIAGALRAHLAEMEAPAPKKPAAPAPALAAKS